MVNADVDKKTEYQCTYNYHNELIRHRFTVAGLYLAATGVVLSKVVELEAEANKQMPPVLWICFGMVGLAIACLCLEGRTRFLYQAIGRRLNVLESTLGEQTDEGKQTPLFYFCYTEKEGHKDTNATLQQQLKSHTLAFRLLYWGSLFFWGVYGVVYGTRGLGCSEALCDTAISAMIALAIVVVPYPLWERYVVNPIKACVLSWLPRSMGGRNSGSRNQ